MTPNGTLQVVEDVESDSDDGPPPLGASDSDAASDSIPPPLVTDDESGDGDAGGDDEPTALTDLDSSEEEQSDDGEDSDIPSLLDGSDDSSDDNEVESDIESVPSGLAAASEEEDTDQLPNLDDPAVSSPSNYLPALWLGPKIDHRCAWLQRKPAAAAVNVSQATITAPNMAQMNTWVAITQTSSD